MKNHTFKSRCFTTAFKVCKKSHVVRQIVILFIVMRFYTVKKKKKIHTFWAFLYQRLVNTSPLPLRMYPLYFTNKKKKS